MNYIQLSKPILFLEFFVREVSYFGKDQATTFPPHTLFYTGESMASRLGDARSLSKVYKARFGTKPVFGFKDNLPCLSNESNVLWSFNEHIQRKSVLDTILWIGGEHFTQNTWKRNPDWIRFSYSNQFPFMEVAQKAPFGFSVLEVDQLGTVKTNFPRKPIIHTVEANQTYLFLCRKEEYHTGEWAEPTQCITLFVKNCGFHQQVQLVSQKEIEVLDTAHLCRENVKVRDYRKSSLKYQLG